MDELSLDDLLAWARVNGRYIEIYGNGTAEVQWGEGYCERVQGVDLRDALTKAKDKQDKEDGQAWTRADGNEKRSGKLLFT